MNCEGFLASQSGDLGALRKMNPRYLRGLTFEGDNALHIAAREGHLDVVEWILDNVKGLSGECNDDRNTPLHEAAKGGNPQVVRILLCFKKSCASKQNQFGETPLLIACEDGHVEAAKILLEATPNYLIIWPSNNRRTCLDVAAYGGHLDVVKLLLAKRMKCKWKTNWLLNILISPVISADDIPLHRAVHGGHADIVREILRSSEWKYFMTKKDEFGRCAVHVAVVQGRLSIIDELISSFPSCVKICSQDFKTALHFAVEYNRIEVVQKLLFNKVSTKVAMLVSYDSDISGNTALHLAATIGVDPQLMEYILSFPGVKVNALNNEGLTALDIAASEKEPTHDRIVDILEAAGATRTLKTLSKSNSQDPQNKTEVKDDSKIVDVDTLVASLIATVTFVAIFQIPGGIENDKRYVQYGAAKLGLDKLFRVFLFSDSLAFFTSLTVINAWLLREHAYLFPRAKMVLEATSLMCLGFSILCTGFTFVIATLLVVIPRNLKALKYKESNDFKEYKNIFDSEVQIVLTLPCVVVLYLLVAWGNTYMWNATNKTRIQLKNQLTKTLHYLCGILILFVFPYLLIALTSPLI